MTKATAALLFAATLASFAGACSDDEESSDSGFMMPPGSPALGADAATTPGGGAPEGGAAGGGVPDGGQINPVLDGSPGVADDASSPPIGSGADGGSDASADPGSGDPEFDSCYAQVKPSCVAKDMNTAELMETPCKAITNIPLPLTDGTVYGPKTISAGPYGGKVEWNEGMGTTFANEINIAEEICVPIGIDTFGEPESVVAELKNLRGLDWSLYTIFRPACFKKGEKYPVITWANGTCGEIHGYSGLLSTLASHGFVVIASNSTWTATPPTDTVQLRALDYAKALNEDPMSIYYQKLDLEHIGAMGHSQGAGATAFAASDPRIDAVILWNSATSNDKPFLNVSGERDIGEPTAQSMASEVDAATQPGAWVYFHKVPQTGGTSTGHLTLMEQPERVVDLTVAWWKWQLKGDQDAKKMFVGTDCGLCNMADEFGYGHNSLLQ